jgi:hypothetical protein
MARLRQEAEDGRRYKRLLQKDVVKLGLLLDTGLEQELWQKLAMALDTEELYQVQAAFSKKAAEKFPPVTQLPLEEHKSEKADSAFLI